MVTKRTKAQAAEARALAGAPDAPRSRRVITTRMTPVTTEIEPASAARKPAKKAKAKPAKRAKADPVANTQVRSPAETGGPTAVGVCAHPKADRLWLGYGAQCGRCQQLID